MRRVSLFYTRHYYIESLCYPLLVFRLSTLSITRTRDYYYDLLLGLSLHDECSSEIDSRYATLLNETKTKTKSTIGITHYPILLSITKLRRDWRLLLPSYHITSHQ